MSHSKRQELKSLIQAVYNLEELRPLTGEYALLRRNLQPNVLKRRNLDSSFVETLRQVRVVGRFVPPEQKGHQPTPEST